MRLKKEKSLKQNNLVRIFIFSNLLFWSVNIFSFDLKLNLNVIFIIILGLLVKSKSVTRLYLIINSCLVYGLIISFLSFNENIIYRSLGSFVIFIILLFSIFKISKVVNYNIPILSIKDAKISIVLITAASLIGAILNFMNGNPIWNLSNGGLYAEQSHAAISFVPIFFYLFKNKVSSLFLLIIFLFFTFSSFSTTLIIYLGLNLLVFQISIILKNGFEMNKLKIIFAFILIVLVILYYTDFGQGIEMRINDIINFNNSSNLSSVVYLNAWSLAFSNFYDSYFLGIGFNVMGYNNFSSNQYLDLMTSMGTDKIGIKDGTLYFSKLLSEFGIIALLIFIYLFYKLYKVINNKNYLFENSVLIFLFISIVAIGGFIRSVGYFTGPFILFLFFLFINDNIINSNDRNIRSKY